MMIDHESLLFYDAACLIAAAGSPNGGSGYLLSLCSRGLLRAITSDLVLVEAERNIRAKMSLAALDRYHRLLVLTPITLVPAPAALNALAFHHIVGEKDAHVLAASIAAHAPFLLTLDRALAARTNQAQLPISALTPGEFIRTLLPLHPAYPFSQE
ncbi:MAG: PIN domain-containing protein [Chloroflexi bacterium]|nr:PIN domain-containing protein [Chloroflexota bacterium]